MSNHIHRIASPKKYPVLRRGKHYVVKGEPGPHPKDSSVPLLLVLREMLNIVKTYNEAKKILNEGKILIDQKVRKSLKFPIGLMDVISIPSEGKNYRMIFSEKNKVKLIEIPEEEAKLKLCKIVNKKIIKNGKVQINLHDGRNILVEDNKYKPGDSLLINLPDQYVKKHIPLQKGVIVLVTDGTHIGSISKIVDFVSLPGSLENRVLLMDLKDNSKYETLKKYVFVIGTESPEIKVYGE